MKYEEIIDQIYTMETTNVDNMIDEVDTQLITEGTNLNFKKEYKEIHKDVKDCIKNANKLTKEGKASDAKAEVDKASKKIKEFREYLTNYDDTFSETLAGSILQLLCSTVKATAVGCLTGGIGSVISGIKDVIDIAGGMIEQIKKDKSIDLKTFNVRKNKIIGLVKTLEKSLENMKKNIDKECKKEKTESADDIDIDSIKLNIYESERSQHITAEQRELLFEMLGMME